MICIYYMLNYTYAPLVSCPHGSLLHTLDALLWLRVRHLLEHTRQLIIQTPFTERGISRTEEGDTGCY
jgi:hypothetical protein